MRKTTRTRAMLTAAILTAAGLAYLSANAQAPRSLRVVPNVGASSATIQSAPARPTIECPCVATAGIAPMANGHRTDCASAWTAPHVTERVTDTADAICGCTLGPPQSSNASWYERAPAPWDMFGCYGRKHPRTLILRRITGCSNPHC